jgi:hypothetical protein
MSHRTNIAGTAFVAALFVLSNSACQRHDDQAGWWQDEQQRLELSHNLAIKEYRLQQSGYATLGEIQDLNASNKAGKKKLQDLLRQRSDLAVEVEELDKQAQAAQDKYIREIRRKITGQSFEVLVLNDGRKFQKASVVGVDDGGVAIRHESGTARLRFADLDESQRELFGLVASKSLAAEKQERVQAVAYEKWIDKSVAANQEKEHQLAQVAAQKEREAERVRNMAATRLATSDYVRPLGQPAKSFGSVYSRYSSRGPSYHYYYDNSSSSSYGRTSSSNDRYGSTSVIKQLREQRKKEFSETSIPSNP